MKLYCDDGSTNVKLAWFNKQALQTKLSTNSFKKGWKIEGLGGKGTFNGLVANNKFAHFSLSAKRVF